MLCLPSDFYLLFSSGKMSLPQQPNPLCWDDFKSNILSLSLIADESHNMSTNVQWTRPHGCLQKHGLSTLLNFSFPCKTSAHYYLTFGFCPLDPSLLILFLLFNSLATMPWTALPFSSHPSQLDGWGLKLSHILCSQLTMHHLSDDFFQATQINSDLFVINSGHTKPVPTFDTCYLILCLLQSCPVLPFSFSCVFMLCLQLYYLQLEGRDVILNLLKLPKGIKWSQVKNSTQSILLNQRKQHSHLQ